MLNNLKQRLSLKQRGAYPAVYETCGNCFDYCSDKTVKKLSKDLLKGEHYEVCFGPMSRLQKMCRRMPLRVCGYAISV
ncbi:MAG: hypothetical protein V2A53_01635 [bacterium]